MNFELDWIVTPDEKELFDQIFQTLDTDNDGYIIGTDESVRKIFLKTALVHTTLAHIWNLSDIEQNGRINSEQFALAMHLVNEVKKGNELPKALTPEMVPPSLRPKPEIAQQQQLRQQQEPNQFNNKELQLLADEMNELKNEKHNLEHEVTQQETNLKLKESEIKSIKNEIETMLQMIKQLENQKVEAGKRLDEMEQQTLVLRQQDEELTKKNEIEEAELKVKKEEFESLKSEEQQFEGKVNQLKKDIQAISTEIAESQLLVSKYKNKTIDLEEYINQLNEENKEFDICIASKEVHKLNALIAKQLQPPEGINVSSTQALNKPNCFNDGEFPSFSNEFAADPFAGEDPFANESVPKKDDLFATDAFSNAFGKSNTGDYNDPFSSKSKFNESTPELPPKKSGPPPRPAPPKTSKPQPKANADPWGMQPVSAETSNDPFAPNTTTQQQSSGFANFDEFANFDQAFLPSADQFSLARPGSNNKQLNNNIESFDPFGNFNSNISNQFETNWPNIQPTSNHKSQFNNDNDAFDPFAPVQKLSPTNQFFDLASDDKRRKQIKDDYEFALRLQKESNFQKRKF